YSSHSISIVDLASGQVISHELVDQAFYGLEFCGEGKRLFCSGAGQEVIHAFDFENGHLSKHEQIHLRDVHQRAVPAGLAIDSSTPQLFVANVWRDRVTKVELLAEPKVSDSLLRSNAAPLLTLPDAPALDVDVAAATKRADALLYEYRPEDTFPYSCRLDEK